MPVTVITALWAIVVAASYLSWHPLSFPLEGFRLPTGTAVAHLWPGIVAVGLCWFSGHGLLILLGCPPQTLLTAVTALPTGLMVTAICGLLFGSTIGFTPASLGLTILSLLAISAVSCTRTPWKHVFEEFSRLCSPIGIRITLALLILGTALNLPGVVAPDLAYDDQMYHLSIPRLYRELGRLSFLGDLFPANRPQSFHLFMTWIGLVGNDSAMRALNWLLPGMIALCLLLTLGKRFNATAGCCAALALVMHPQLAWLSRTAYTDLIVLYLALAVVFALSELHRHSSPHVQPHLICLALLSGYAAQVKTSGALLVIISIGGAAATLHWHRLAGEKRQTSCHLFLLFAAAVIILSSPWYLRNWLSVGNPFFPYLQSVFAGQLYLPDYHHIFSELFQCDMPFLYNHELLLDRFGMGQDILSMLLLPWNVTIYGRLHDPAVSLRFFDGQIGFAPLALAPLLIFQVTRQQVSAGFRLLMATVFLSGIFWGFGSHQIRFLLPTLGFVSIAIGILAGTNDAMRRLTIAVLIAGLPTAIGFAVNRNVFLSDFTRGDKTRDEFLKEQLPFMGSYQFINRETASQTRVLPLFEERIYYLNRPFTWMPLVPYPFISAFIVSKSADQVRQYLDRCHIDLIYLPRNGFQTLRDIIDDAAYKQRIIEFFASPSRRLYADRFGEVWTYRQAD
ncbi:MAG TPA: phospholipid carrier-dependent glycosyltransferase [Candidatus Ozemobacteraceae bacterium]|nr:phospholipid carrier-dependent glycosyltransferase [Candidatus Ozemobacteraceae bacterium]